MHLISLAKLIGFDHTAEKKFGLNGSVYEDFSIGT